ncbi:hypothetical protein C1752_07267 [Acaryochloris thomasi RCC1774]|uniref:DUF4089 domain-containing protein n=1 Tax=Acaryochloris thomasi RCC1774 TaxID=1764569 RepID=A0A2W1JID4_9CYAN|nr:DUF4089 domain-containing protein [Acaryochloris thomasi]PZD71305.1 hypothetical protein C1752_07267 [Acaryochloris thomasi RCC1774]
MPETSSHPTNSSATFEVKAYVTQTAKLLGLSIPPEQMGSVVENFESIQTIAQPVLDFPLPDTLEAAPTFEP